MKIHRLVTIILCAACFHVAFAQDMDTELSKLTEDLAAKITTSGSKKVTVLDFADLQGGSTELGKYIAEQLTVDFVMTNRSFSVLDRANLKSVLAEHKLTAKGLVNPENAKQLGKFAGVDALVIGNIIPIGTNINLTVKIITTETAEVVGAAKAKFKTDDTVQQFMSKAAQPADFSGASPQDSTAISKDFGNLSVVVNGIRKLKDGYYSVSLTFQNKSANNPIAVGLYGELCYVPPCHLRSSLVAADGTQLECNDSNLTGVSAVRTNPQRLTAIDAGGERKASITFWSRSVNKTVTSFTFQSEIVVNQNYNAHAYDNYKVDQKSLPPNCKVENMVVEIPAPK